jgi:hypothetical protein
MERIKHASIVVRRDIHHQAARKWQSQKMMTVPSLRTSVKKLAKDTKNIEESLYPTTEDRQARLWLV